MQLKDIAVVITGGGSGLGAATARAMAAKGAKVAVLDVRQEQADAVANEVGRLPLGSAVPAPLRGLPGVKPGGPRSGRMRPP